MNTHANKMKNCLLEIIKEMGRDPQRFAIVDKGCKENECGTACELVDGLSERHPVIIMAD